MAEGLSPTEGEGNEDDNMPWMPWVVVQKTCSFLDHEDQYNVSQVCENWYETFIADSNWKSYKFALTEKMLSTDPWSLKDVLYQKADTLKKVMVDYSLGIVSSPMIDIWMNRFSTLMEILTEKTQLAEITFDNLLLVFGKRSNPIHENICTLISNFLASQHQLKHVHFRMCFFEYRAAVGLVKKAIEKNKSSLSHLRLRAFAWNDPKDEEQEQILPTLIGLPNLSLIEIDYCMVLGKFANPTEVFEALRNCKKRLSLIIILLVDKHTSSLQKFTSSDWTNLKDNANLRVTMYVATNSRNWRQNEFIIVPGTPISYLNFILSEKSSFSRMEQFSKHVLSCNTNEHLLQFVFGLETSIPDLAEALLPFLIACQKLKILHLKAVYPVNGLEDLLESLGKNRATPLQKFELKISRIGSEENKIMLDGLVSKYAQALNLKVKLVL